MSLEIEKVLYNPYFCKFIIYVKNLENDIFLKGSFDNWVSIVKSVDCKYFEINTSDSFEFKFINLSNYYWYYDDKFEIKNDNNYIDIEKYKNQPIKGLGNILKSLEYGNSDFLNKIFEHETELSNKPPNFGKRKSLFDLKFEEGEYKPISKIADASDLNLELEETTNLKTGKTSFQFSIYQKCLIYDIIKQLQLVIQHTEQSNQVNKFKTESYNHYIELQKEINKNYPKDKEDFFAEINKVRNEMENIRKEDKELIQQLKQTNQIQSEQITDLKKELEMLIETVKQYHKKEIKN